MKLKWFKHINQDQRIKIYAMIEQWLSYRKIWLALWRHHTSISREVERNSIENQWWWTKYNPLIAENKYIKRRKTANLAHIKLRNNHSLRSKIHHILSDSSIDWWPNEILWRLKLEWWKVVSTSTLYRYIRSYTQWWKYLRYKQEWYKYKKRKRSTKITIKWVQKIDKRPSIIDERKRIWDWEIDTVVSCREWQWWLFTATDRKSRYELIKKVWNLKSHTLYITMLSCFYWEKVNTLTSDNWSEFALLADVQEQMNIKCYTANPYCSYERGTNERHNWFIRRYIPKKSDISKYSEEEIQVIQNKLNHKPRKCLDYRTPYEVYHNTKLNYIS